MAVGPGCWSVLIPDVLFWLPKSLTPNYSFYCTNTFYVLLGICAIFHDFKKEY